MNGLTYFENAIDKAVLNIRTAYLAKVLDVKGKTARLQPLTVYKAVGGSAKAQKTTTAVIPQNIKFKEETITYMTSDTATAQTTVLTPQNLAVGDIVYVGVCDRDITNAVKGIISEATPRHHDINDGVILRVL